MRLTDPAPAGRTLRRRALAVGLAAGGAALAGAVLYVEAFVSAIARRRSPLTDLLTSRPAPPGPRNGADRAHEEGADALLRAPMEAVQIQAADGVTLRGRWYPCPDARRAVLLAHGFRSSWNRNFGSIAPFLRESGCSLLLIDQRCHGGSGGAYITYGVRESRDVLDWVDWLERRCPSLPVYLGGVSMGASAVLMAADRIGDRRVFGIIADCGYTCPREIVLRSVRASVGRLSAPTLAAADLALRLRAGFSLGRVSTLEAMAGNRDVPVLFIHGDADPMVPWRMSLENCAVCRAPKELLIVPGAGHARCFDADPARCRAAVLRFFEANDPPRTAGPPKADPQGAAGERAEPRGRGRKVRGSARPKRAGNGGTA